MNLLFWALVYKWIVLLLIIAAAFVLPEPRYREVRHGGAWTEEKSVNSAINRLIYARRAVRRGAGVGLLFGVLAFFLTWLVRGSLS